MIQDITQLNQRPHEKEKDQTVALSVFRKRFSLPVTDHGKCATGIRKKLSSSVISIEIVARWNDGLEEGVEG